MVYYRCAMCNLCNHWTPSPSPLWLQFLKSSFTERTSWSYDKTYQVIFWPNNIVDLFKQFGVKKNFDFLSEDSDSYDFFMTEAILKVYPKTNKLLPDY